MHRSHISKNELGRPLNLNRDTPWRQGHVIPSDVVPDLDSGRVAVIITHDCDIPHQADPSVEYIAGLPVEKIDKQYQKSRHASCLLYTSPSPRDS